jgi:hypothetical protein
VLCCDLPGVAYNHFTVVHFNGVQYV